MAGKNDNAELQQFYYHPDHLGSSSYISNLDGEVVQHVEYVPFGEVFLEEKNAKWNTPYLFTSKELDRETGLYYFGARYQDPKLGIFLGVDPKAEKFKGVSSYAYALNNPIKFIDPDGKAPDWHRDGAGALVADKGDTAESLAKFKGISVQKARAEFNHNHYRFESTMSGGETFYNSERHVSSGAYGPDKNWKHAVIAAGVVVLPVIIAEGAVGLSLSQMSWGTATTGMTSNAAAQYLTNGRKLKDINMISTASAAVPGIGPAVFGETFSYSVTNIMEGTGPTMPESFEKWAVQAGSAVISNRFGKAADSYPAGFGKSKEVFGGKRDNKSFELSGAKLIKDLSIEPGPKKD
jgi:RHS repeat-associated protein